ncbi:cellulose synthase complex periplasmic endoglucanase BcsZ [Pulveribacter suum]|uniref:cellulase n=1 Tax=Pulveribacter suum TaxID=2116657 RepID=A0A2P1NH51_9BURK|nr:cellulose synthase complex periplasmic endoglucanase BcsZ [Pulveribacter suum]AVP56383.1 cellulase [Pulveribacter suum]
MSPITRAPDTARAARRALHALGLWCALLPAAMAQGASCSAAASWPLWEQFVQRFMQADGRVIDHSTAQLHSTSEGQSYAMFFALVANDRTRFDKLWNWSIANLAGGDIGARLPAWQWGRKADASWGVVDANPASDANLWFAYALAEAGRAWREPRYTAQAQTLLAQVAIEEVADLPGLGPTLLPAASGFALRSPERRTWRLNPSYLPVPLLRAFERIDGQGPWKAVGISFRRMLEGTTPKGFAADWVAYEVPEGALRGTFARDPEKGDTGSYDAIRTYLWAGMTPTGDALAPVLRRRLGGMAEALRAAPMPPEKVQTTTGQREGQGPVGFSAALLPYLRTLGATAALKAQQERVRTQLLEPPPGGQPLYYDQVLGLFGTGWMDQRYQFLPSGRLQLRWEKACPQRSATTAP